MKFLDIVFDEPAYNLACDEALLDLCEEGESDEVLRFWEPREHFIVLGYSGKIDSEVNLPFCEAQRIPVFRRVSGGGTVLQGPGCLNYALVLSISKHQPLGSLTESHRFVLGRHKEILEPLLRQEIQILGQSDLVLDNFKFSGNAQRRRRRFLLYHGTFLISLDLKLMEKALPIPHRQPSYRKYRPHQKFLTHTPVSSKQIAKAIRDGWGAESSELALPMKQIKRLVEDRYGTRPWNYKF